MHKTAVMERGSRVARPLTSFILALVVLGWTSAARAEEEKKIVETKIVSTEAAKTKTPEDVQGWNHALGVNGTINFVNNRTVIGQLEGTSMLFGLGLSGGSDYVNGKSLWRNKLSVAETFARTPALDDFVKTNDIFEVDTNYNYFIKKSLGVFARGNAKTNLFNTFVYTAVPVTYRVLPNNADDTPVDQVTDRLQVASSFKPLAFEETVGVFAQPVKRKQINMRIRAGLGGRHTLADGVLLKKDDAATPEIEMQELADVHQAGAEMFVGIDGKVQKGRITYNTGLTMFLPFVNNDTYGRSNTELLRVALGMEAKVPVFDWMSLVYKGELIADPQLFPAGKEVTQIQNSLLLTFQFTLIERKKAKKEPSELDQIKKAKEEAEKAAKEAKERADKLEKEIEELKQQAKDQAAPGATPENSPDGTTPDPNVTPDPNATPEAGTTPTPAPF